MRSDKINYLIKGFHQDKDTYLGSIVKLVWANNPTMMENLYTRAKYCSLYNNGNECYCNKHSFLRGNDFY